MSRPLAESPDPIDVNLGRRMRAERIRLGLTQSAVGAAVGVSFQQIQKYERGASRISTATLLRFARSLDVAVTDLLPAADVPRAPRLEDEPVFGGRELAQCYLALTPQQRETVLRIAREFAACRA